MGCHRVSWTLRRQCLEKWKVSCGFFSSPCLWTCFSLGSHIRRNDGVWFGVCLNLLGVFSGGAAVCRPDPRWAVWHFPKRFLPFAHALSSADTQRAGPSEKLPGSGDDVLPKSNSESHRSPRLCPWNGDTAREVQKERFPGHITGRLWLSASYRHTHAHTHTECVHTHTLWGILCLLLWLISLPLQTNLFGTRLIFFWRHLSVRFALCGILITLHRGAVLLRSGPVKALNCWISKLLCILPDS